MLKFEAVLEESRRFMLPGSGRTGPGPTPGAPLGVADQTPSSIATSEIQDEVAAEQVGPKNTELKVDFPREKGTFLHFGKTSSPPCLSSIERSSASEQLSAK